MNLQEAQNALNHLGYGPLVLENSSGPATKLAVVRFQRDHDLPANGVIDSMTARALVNSIRQYRGTMVRVSGTEVGAFDVKTLFDTPTKKWAWGVGGFAVALGAAFWADKAFGKKGHGKRE